MKKSFSLKRMRDGIYCFHPLFIIEEISRNNKKFSLNFEGNQITTANNRCKLNYLKNLPSKITTTINNKQTPYNEPPIKCGIFGVCFCSLIVIV